MEVARVVIDTDMLIDLLRGVERNVNIVRRMEEEGAQLSTTTINAFELYYGAYRSRRREENLSSTRRLLDRLILLTLDPTSAEVAGRVYAELEQSGQPIGLKDALIGAISMIHGYTLATRNVEHLRRIPGLNVLAPP